MKSSRPRDTRGTWKLEDHKQLAIATPVRKSEQAPPRAAHDLVYCLVTYVLHAGYLMLASFRLEANQEAWFTLYLDPIRGDSEGPVAFSLLARSYSRYLLDAFPSI